MTEDVRPVPKNIYGVTKTAAEDLCELFHRRHRLACLVLRTSRFFLEVDDDPTVRRAYDDDNVKANEYLYRRVDLQDVVDAHVLAIEKAPSIGFGRYIISATTPFQPDDLADLRLNAPQVVERRVPEYAEEYARRGWKMFPGIERVYVNERARRELGWQPRYDFRRIIACLRTGDTPRSPLAHAVGSKGYHDREFADGPYPCRNGRIRLRCRWETTDVIRGSPYDLDHGRDKELIHDSDDRRRLSVRRGAVSHSGRAVRQHDMPVSDLPKGLRGGDRAVAAPRCGEFLVRCGSARRVQIVTPGHANLLRALRHAVDLLDHELRADDRRDHRQPR